MPKNYSQNEPELEDDDLENDDFEDDFGDVPSELSKAYSLLHDTGLLAMTLLSDKVLSNTVKEKAFSELKTKSASAYAEIVNYYYNNREKESEIQKRSH
jgi:hypothetical protein